MINQSVIRTWAEELIKIKHTKAGIHTFLEMRLDVTYPRSVFIRLQNCIAAMRGPKK